jgi:hypothetical protein
VRTVRQRGGDELLQFGERDDRGGKRHLPQGLPEHGVVGQVQRLRHDDEAAYRAGVGGQVRERGVAAAPQLVQELVERTELVRAPDEVLGNEVKSSRFGRLAGTGPSSLRTSTE